MRYINMYIYIYIHMGGSRGGWVAMGWVAMRWVARGWVASWWVARAGSRGLGRELLGLIRHPLDPSGHLSISIKIYFIHI